MGLTESNSIGKSFYKENPAVAMRSRPEVDAFRNEKAQNEAGWPNDERLRNDLLSPEGHDYAKKDENHRYKVRRNTAEMPAQVMNLSLEGLEAPSTYSYDRHSLANTLPQ